MLRVIVQFCYPTVRVRVPVPLPNITDVCLFIFALLVGVKCYLNIVSIGISLMAKDVEHLFMCLLAICVSSLEKYPFKSFAHFKIGSFYD